ncbi:MAG: glycosyltransferase family 2 protein [Burkholderiales bacterium]|nr:glycosyltransferase family 2 protein [Burkholderiales bacterium]
MAQSYFVRELINLSAVFITKNAASQLEYALKSVQFCRDIVVLDSGSTDGTQALALRYGARVYQQDWLGFGPQKQKAVELAKFDWVLCLDADERVSQALSDNIINTLKTPELTAYQMPRSNFFIDRYLRHGEGYPDLSLRLFNRKHARWSDDAVHERVLSQGAVGLLKGDLLHHSAETLEVYLSKQNRYTEIQARQLAAAGKPPGFGKLLVSPLVRFIKFYGLRGGFRDGWPGLVHICIGCFNSFIKYAKARALLESKDPDQL